MPFDRSFDKRRAAFEGAAAERVRKESKARAMHSELLEAMGKEAGEANTEPAGGQRKSIEESLVHIQGMNMLTY